MKTRKEMIEALKARIKQIDECIQILRDKTISNESVREELQTFLDWAKEE